MESGLFAAPSGWVLAERFVTPCVVPYRLDLTVAVLRRTLQNPVDILAADGRYMRVFAGPGGPQVCAAYQPPGTTTLDIAIYHSVAAGGDPRPRDSGLQTLLPRVLGTQVDLSGFYADAAKLPELAPLVARAMGVKPPRYPSLWEALCNSVVFQQISLDAAMATMRRVIAHFSKEVAFGDSVLYPFPTPESFIETSPPVLASLGLSAAKVRTLQEVAGILLNGELTAEELEALPTADGMARLTVLRGIGPWTAAVIMLRGFGRLDVFPAGDSGAQRNLRGLIGAGRDTEAKGAAIVEALGPWRGMLYYHLLLWRLAHRDLVSLDAGAT